MYILLFIISALLALIVSLFIDSMMVQFSVFVIVDGVAQTCGKTGIATDADLLAFRNKLKESKGTNQ